MSNERIKDEPIRFKPAPRKNPESVFGFKEPVDFQRSPPISIRSNQSLEIQVKSEDNRPYVSSEKKMLLCIGKICFSPSQQESSCIQRVHSPWLLSLTAVLCVYGVFIKHLTL